MSTASEVTTQTPERESESTDTQLKLGIPDVYAVAQALDVSIKRKTFNEEEIQKIYGPWSRVLRFCEDIKRKTDVEKLYNTEQSKDDDTKEDLPPIEELSVDDSEK